MYACIQWPHIGTSLKSWDFEDLRRPLLGALPDLLRTTCVPRRLGKLGIE